MSDDQSYYEIQLNFPHLVLIFLGAAVVGVAFFWLGVVIGSGRSGAGDPSEWQGAVPAEQGDSAAGEADDEPLGFYDDVNEPVSQATPSADDPTAEQTTPAEQTEAAEQSEGPPNERDFRPADPVDEARDPVVADSQSGLPRADASLVSGWIVQVRSTTEELEANRLQAALVMAGFPAFLVSAEVDGETWYRVRVGRYPSRADAEAVEAALQRRAEVEDTWVTQG